MRYKYRRIDYAYELFDRMPESNVVSWTALMLGLLNQDKVEASLGPFGKMGWSDVKPNEYTLSMVLKACGLVGIAENGLQVQGLCVKTGYEWFMVVSNALIDMYAKCGIIGEAALITRGFTVLDHKIILYALLDLYVKCGYLCKARKLFDHIGRKNLAS